MCSTFRQLESCGRGLRTDTELHNQLFGILNTAFPQNILPFVNDTDGILIKCE